MRPVMSLMAALLVLGVAPLTAQTTFTVTSNDDVDDGTCSVGPGHCSLREAINAANASAATTDTIAFNITGAGPHTIAPGSALPTISDPLVIDGYTQSGASVNTNPVGQAINATPMIVLDGSGAGGVSGLTITAAGCTVRGLVINQFGLHGIEISGAGASGNLVEGNFIGTDANGTTDLGNNDDGVFIESGPTNTVGGTAAASRNLVSGNGLKGIDISNPTASGNVVQGNYIGTDVNGTAAIPNDEQGISIDGAPNNTIGGTATDAGNVISGNTANGVEIIFAGATGNVVQGNFIGTDVSGTADLGNGENGVQIFEASNNTIGGTGVTPGQCDGPCNTIAFNGTPGGAHDGVRLISSGTGNAVRGNAIFSNGGLGIDLDVDGVTANDPGDFDTGPNNVQNFPVLSAAFQGSTIIEGTLNSTASTAFTIEFFSSGSCDASGHGEGEAFLGSTVATTDGSGNASFAVSFPATLPTGTSISATATDPSGNTSEFSQCATVAPQVTDFTMAATPSSVTVARGASATYTVTVTPQGGSVDAPVTLSCTGLAAQASCAFSPSSVTPGGTSATATVTVSTAAGTPTGSDDFTIVGTERSLERGATAALVVTDFTVAVSPSSASVSGGQSATYTVTVAPDGGSFGESVSLACSGLPTGGSCSFSPSAVTPGASAETSTLTLSTSSAARTLIAPRWDGGARGVGVLALLSLALSGLALALVRWAPREGRRRWALMGGAALAFALLLGACSGGDTTGPSPQTHTITVTGTAGSLEHSATMTLTVQ